MPTTDLTPALAQNGYESGGSWTEDPLGSIIGPSYPGRAACRYGPTVIPTHRLVNAASLTFAYSNLGDRGGPIKVGVPLYPAFSGAWSSSNLPSRHRLITIALAEAPPNSAGNLTVTLDAGVLHSLIKQTAVAWDTYIPFTFERGDGRRGWYGGLTYAFGAAGLTLTYPSGADDVIGTAPSMPGGLDRHARSDLCPRCGTPSFRDTWVRDGYRGTLVHAECFDPAEPERTPSPPARGPLVGG